MAPSTELIKNFIANDSFILFKNISTLSMKKSYTKCNNYYWSTIMIDLKWSLIL